LSGANLVHDVGLLDQASLVDPVTILFCDEVIDHVKHFMRGIHLDKENFALDVINDVGAGGNYLSENHTLNHFKDFWSPTYFNRPSLDGKVGKSLLEALNEKVLDIEKNHEVPPLEEDKLKALQELEKKWLKA
jgi:trimethylamine--corrinoid protein Co-methyltransferase